MKLGDSFPNFTAKTNLGEITFYDHKGENWAILFSHPADFTPVCTTELARAASLAEEFKKRKVVLLALSCDSAETHKEWINDITAYADDAKVTAEQFPFEIIEDHSRELATKLEMLDPNELDKEGLPLTARAVFIIGPKNDLKASILYPATTGRNFDEILRLVDSLQLTMKHPIATPENWKNGDDCVAQPSLKDNEVKDIFGEDKVKFIDLPSKKSYLRKVPQPN
ncbi:unnamed protein product [Auanema sp. JU1783]|nr:unnamed protein product [Auanema sp. JU1783]